MTKFLDQAGLEILWGKIKNADKINAAAIETKANQSALDDTNSAVDGILNGDKPLVTPSFYSTYWQVYKNDGTTTVGAAKTSTNVTVETGFKVKFTGAWRWSADSTKKNPTSTSGTWGTTLPVSGNPSSTYTSDMLSANKTFTQSISAPKAGLVYEDGKIHKATAGSNDTTSCSASVTFGYGIFYGVATAGTPTDALIKGLTTEIVTSKTKQVTAGATSSTQMYVYAYPAAWGDLKAISKDGVDAVLTAFNKTTVSHDNGSGAAAVTYNVYYTGNGALNSSCTLKFE